MSDNEDLRRLKALYIPSDAIVELLSNWSVHEMVRLPQLVLPSDATVISCNADFIRNAFVLRIHSKEYAIVPHAQMLEVIEFEYKTVEIKISKT
jgi:hypothetical protein